MLRDLIEGQNENLLDDRWRIRVVNQHELWKAGCTCGVVRVGEPLRFPRYREGISHLFESDYIGSKWGIYLRAPDVFFKLLDRCGSRLVALGQLAEIRRGVTSGADDFFFVRDVTEDEILKCGTGLPPGSPHIARRFTEKWAIRLADTERIRVVESGDGSRHLIEAKYLEPEVHSLMELDSAEIDPTRLSRKILLVSDPPEKLRGTHALQYVKWGEREGFDQGATCSARAKTRAWYDVTVDRRSPVLWPKAHQYRHIIPLNPKRLIPNCRMYDLFLQPQVDAELLGGVLNSTVVALTKFLFGRPVGREGSLDTEVVDVNMMLVPDVRGVRPEVAKRVKDALNEIRGRTAKPLLEEFGLADRQRLDDATLELLEIEEQGRKPMRRELYSQVEVLYQEIREVELKKQVERRITARRDRASPHTIAEEIWEEFDKSALRTFPLAFMPKGEETERVTIPAGKPKVLDDLFERGAVQINGNVIRLGSKARAEFAAKIAELGHYGQVPIPKSDRACERSLEAYRRYEAQMESTFKDLAEERSADPETQARIVRELQKIHLAYCRKEMA